MRFLTQITAIYGLVFLSLSGCAQPKQTVEAFFTNWKTHKDLQSASYGVLVLDKSGKVILEHNSNISLVPASTQKLLTTAAALQELGANHQFETKLFYSGNIDENGVLNGDLWIEGGGDPTLGSERFVGLSGLSDSWTKAIQSAGIKQVNGRIRTNTSLFPKFTTPRTWIWEDIGNYYGAVPHALSFHDNTYQLNLSSPIGAGALCEVKSTYPEMEHLKFTSFVQTANNNRDNAYIFGAENSNDRYIKGTIPKGKGTFTIKGAMNQPDLVLAKWFANALEKGGITVSGQPNETTFVKENLKFIYTHKSPTVAEIVKLTNQHSINLYAEHLNLAMSSKRGEELSIEQAAEELKSNLEKMQINTSGMFLKDGSGLSRFNAFSPAQMVALLNYMQTTSNKETFEVSLSVAGESGTLRRMFYDSPAAGKILAKSGYMERVRSYAGYINKSETERYTFCVIVNNYEGSAAGMKHHIKQLLEKLAE